VLEVLLLPDVLPPRPFAENGSKSQKAIGLCDAAGYRPNSMGENVSFPLNFEQMNESII
jgi:hypothetical protein